MVREVVEDDVAASKASRKAARLAAAAAAAEAAAEAEAVAKRLRKAAKRAAAEAAMAASEDDLAPDSAETKRQTRRAAAAASTVDVAFSASDEADLLEAKRLRKAARHALKAAAVAEAEDTEVDPAEAKRQRKAATPAGAINGTQAKAPIHKAKRGGGWAVNAEMVKQKASEEQERAPRHSSKAPADVEDEDSLAINGCPTKAPVHKAKRGGGWAVNAEMVKQKASEEQERAPKHSSKAPADVEDEDSLAINCRPTKAPVHKAKRGGGWSVNAEMVRQKASDAQERSPNHASKAPADVEGEDSDADFAQAKRQRKAAVNDTPAKAPVHKAKRGGGWAVSAEMVKQSPSDAPERAPKHASTAPACAEGEDVEVDLAVAKMQRKAANSSPAINDALLANTKTSIHKAKRGAGWAVSAEMVKQELKSKEPAGLLTVFVGCLPFKADEATLWKDFSECGEIEELVMPKSADGRAGGFAFITYKTREGVAAALKYNKTDYGGRTILIKIDGKVFVKGIANRTSDAEVREFFEPCGDIQSLSVPRWEDGGAKGTAHINFTTSEGVEAALALNGTSWGPMTLSVQKAAQGSGSSKERGKGKSKGRTQ